MFGDIIHDEIIHEYFYTLSILYTIFPFLHARFECRKVYFFYKRCIIHYLDYGKNKS